MHSSPGQHMIIGIEGGELSHDERSFIIDEAIGGVILFARNIHSLDQLQTLCQQLVEAGRQRGVVEPFFLAIDQEGGLVSRLVQFFPDLPSAMSFGRSGDMALLRDTTAFITAWMCSLGLNMNFTPVVDLYNPLNQQLLTRCFAADPELVCQAARVVVDATLENGMLPCLKHFPGLGRCLIDTHHAAGIVDCDIDQWEHNDVLPFERLIQQGAPLVMISHAAYPRLTGSEEPASLSPFIIDTVLRRRFGFDGLSISDDLEMRAIEHCGTMAELARKALTAGNDILLVCHRGHLQREALEAIKGGIRSGEIDPGELASSCHRMTRVSRMVTVNGDDTDRRGETTLSLAMPTSLAGRIQRHLAQTVLVCEDATGRSLEPDRALNVFTKTSQLLSRELRHRVERDGYGPFAPHHPHQIVECAGHPRVFEEPLDNEDPVLLFGRGWSGMQDRLSQCPWLRPGQERSVYVLLTGDPAEREVLPAHFRVLALFNETIASLTEAIARLTR